MGGNVSVAATPGKGATFVVELEPLPRQATVTATR